MPRDAEIRKKRLAVVLFNLGGPDQPAKRVDLGPVPTSTTSP